MAKQIAAAEPDDEAAPAAASPAPPKGTSMIMLLLAVGILTLLAVGAGGMFGLQVLAKVGAPSSAGSAEAPKEPPAKPLHGPGTELRALTPIITNLTSPERTWIRLEASVVFDADLGADANALAASLTEDITAYLRTLSLAQIEGASGFQHLREDLMDRARIRGGSKVRDVIVHTLIIE